MPITTDQTPPARAVNIRLKDNDRYVIDQAAKALGKTRTDFMVDAARRAAENALLDQTYISVDQESFDLYKKMLDQTPNSKGYADLMNASKPWR